MSESQKRFEEQKAAMREYLRKVGDKALALKTSIDLLVEVYGYDEFMEAVGFFKDAHDEEELNRQLEEES